MKKMDKVMMKGCSIALTVVMGVTLLMVPGMERQKSKGSYTKHT